METQKDKDYFADTTAISNSQLRTFVSYNKYGQRLLTPDDYIAEYIDKAVSFIPNEAVIVGKIVDKYFDGTGTEVWNYFIPVARRTGKEIKFIIDRKIEKAEDEIGRVATKEIKDQITKEVNEDYTEITNKMKEDADLMITRGLSFRKFKSFLLDEGTDAQTNLKKEIEITDKESGEVRKILMKGKPDFINKNKKIIVDLKTSGSREMIIDSLQFKGEPILSANYIRQLSIYNKLSGGDYDGALALVTATGVKWISVPNQILIDAWEILEQDILDLDKFLENPETLDESIFSTSEDELTL